MFMHLDAYVFDHSGSVRRADETRATVSNSLISLAFWRIGALVEQTFISGFVRFEAVFIGIFAWCSAWS